MKNIPRMKWSAQCWKEFQYTICNTKPHQTQIWSRKANHEPMRNSYKLKNATENSDTISLSLLTERIVSQSGKSERTTSNQRL